VLLAATCCEGPAAAPVTAAAAARPLPCCESCCNQQLIAERYPNGMPDDLVVRIVTTVASALDHAHKKGLLHCGVKPANIMLTHLEDEDGK
jgi:hypothetical protein